MRKTIAALLICLITTGLFTNTFAGSYYNDLDEHWATEAIERFSDKNIIMGSEGNFRPDASITRGEMAVILDRIMKFEEKSDNDFSDLDENFYTESVLKANYAGVILGDSGLIRPLDAITLQEVSAMLCRAFEISNIDAFETEFLDDSEISDWARGYLCALINADLLHGSEGFLNPDKRVSRAQVVTILDNMYTSGLETLAVKLDSDNSDTVPTVTPTEASATATPQQSTTSGSSGGSSSPSSEEDENLDEDIPSDETEEEENGITIETSLTDGAIQKGSKKTFDVWAADENGNKITPEVTLNDQPVDINWDDSLKTSFTLLFTDIGENIIKITATGRDGAIKEVSYSITYELASPGDIVGSCVWSFEAFSIGCGYIIPPTKFDIIEGESAALMLDRIIKEAGLDYEHTGSLDESFYLSYIIDGENTLDLNPQIPEILSEKLINDMDYYDPDSWYEGMLGEFDFSNGSGWTYSLNNIFPNVGFADTYLSEGDIVRVQYTLNYGLDNGGYGAAGIIPEENLYFGSVNRDALTAAIAEKSISSCSEDVILIATRIDASQKEINNALSKIR